MSIEVPPGGEERSAFWDELHDAVAKDALVTMSCLEGVRDLAPGEVIALFAHARGNIQHLIGHAFDEAELSWLLKQGTRTDGGG